MKGAVAHSFLSESRCLSHSSGTGKLSSSGLQMTNKILRALMIRV